MNKFVIVQTVTFPIATGKLAFPGDTLYVVPSRTQEIDCRSQSIPVFSSDSV